MMLVSRFGWFIVALFLVGASVNGQCDPRWLPGHGTPGITRGSLTGAALPAVAAATAWDPDGTGPAREVLVAAGDFIAAGSTPARNIAAWDGVSWSTLGQGRVGPVAALAVFQDRLVAAGWVNVPDGTATSVARWDGAAWEELGEGAADGRIVALAVVHDELIAAAHYVQGDIWSSIERWDGSSWKTLGRTSSGYVNSNVNAMAVHDGNLIVGGFFTAISDVAANSVAQWDGESWHALGAGTGPEILTIGSFHGDLVVGGIFNLGLPTYQSLFRWNGTEWQDIGVGLPFSRVQALVEDGDGLIAGAGWAGGVARWDGSTWTSMDDGMAGEVGCLARYKGELIAGGTIAGDGDEPFTNIARWSGSAWTALSLAGMDGPVEAFVEHNGSLVAGGLFKLAGGVPAARVARWDGEAWHPLGAGLSGGSPVPGAFFFSSIWTGAHALTIHERDLVVGGLFDTAGLIPAEGIARWDGESWSTLGAGVAGAVLSLTAYHADLIAGGHFSAAGGVPVNNIARWDGVAWHPLGSGITNGAWIGPYLIAEVPALAVFNGDLIAGGLFSIAGGVPARGIARWNGANWTHVGGGVWGEPGDFACVQALTVSDGRLLVAGRFTRVGVALTPADCIASWDGANWQPLGSGLSGSISALAVRGGELVAAGYLSLLAPNGSYPNWNIIRWDGRHWYPLGGGTDGFVDALGTYRGHLYAGGDFNAAGGVVSARWARWGCPACYADCDKDGALTVADFGCFQTRFVAADPYADCNGDGAVTVSDFGCFQTKFAAGCS